MTAPAQQATPLREGFVAVMSDPRPSPPPQSLTEQQPLPPEPPPPAPAPRDAPPQEPLPSQMKLEQPPPEPPLSVLDEARRDIAANPDTWPITVQLLYKPIKNTKGELVSSLSFRQPRAADINRIGNPTRIVGEGEIIIEERKMTYIMAALCGLLPPELEDMDPRDWNSCAWRLRKFFLPDLRAWS